MPDHRVHEWVSKVSIERTEKFVHHNPEWSSEDVQMLRRFAVSERLKKGHNRLNYARFHSTMHAGSAQPSFDSVAGLIPRSRVEIDMLLQCISHWVGHQDPAPDACSGLAAQRRSQ